MRRATLAIVCLAALLAEPGCACRGRAHPPPTEGPNAMSTGKLTWKSHELPGGVRVDVADGVDLNHGVFEGKTYANQRFGPAAMAVSLGPGEDLDAWQALFRARHRIF